MMNVSESKENMWDGHIGWDEDGKDGTIGWDEVNFFGHIIGSHRWP